ncbi:hypothetical protein [Arthrobacter sp. HS15c]|uniref:hypothetical protein n=1 Tax=Arthrobacter sp. HS15c TaxID=3230279 RepID=UPI0034671A71
MFTQDFLTVIRRKSWPCHGAGELIRLTAGNQGPLVRAIWLRTSDRKQVVEIR